MAEDLKQEIGTLAENVKGLKEKADKVEGVETVAKGAKLTAEEAKQAAENAAKEAAEAKKAAGEFSEWKVKKDERDEANQKALNEIIAGQKEQMKMNVNHAQKSFSEVLTETLDEKENQEAFNDFLRKGTGKLKMQMKAVADMTFTNNFSTASISTTMFRPGTIMRPNRKVHVRQLLPGGNMTGSALTYLKEGAGEGAPAAVAEGTLKAQFDLDLSEATAQSQYIAGWVRISRKMLDDVQGMVSYLNTRLPEKLLVAEDAQLLNGSGTGANLKGITTAGNFTAATSSATIDIEQIIDAIAQLEDANERNATGILVRPSDYYSFFKNKAAGSGEYDLPSNVTFVNGVLYVAGVPMFASTAATVDQFIVGDFEMGAQLFIREAPSIVFAYEDGINIRENMVTVRIEERVAFPVYGSDFFIVGDLGNVV